MVNRKLLGKASYKWGKQLEELTYRRLNQITSNVHTNIKIPIPQGIKDPYNQHYVEADIIFHYKRTLYIVQCKRRKSMHYKSPIFGTNGTHIYQSGHIVTAKYLGNLWQSEKYIKHHRMYEAYGRPNIKTVFLLDGILKGVNDEKPYVICRNTLMTTFDLLPKFLKKLRTSPREFF